GETKDENQRPSVLGQNLGRFLEEIDDEERAPTPSAPRAADAEDAGETKQAAGKIFMPFMVAKANMTLRKKVKASRILDGQPSLREISSPRPYAWQKSWDELMKKIILTDAKALENGLSSKSPLQELFLSWTDGDKKTMTCAEFVKKIREEGRIDEVDDTKLTSELLDLPNAQCGAH
ncbi:hypothetical protein CYMTET_35515, partial [Cymbomonas tetramitiformis]